MRYRRVGYRYTVMTSHTTTWTMAPLWRAPVASLMLGRPHWRPDADLCETKDAIDVVVDLAGMEEDDFEVQLFDDALVVEGRRRLPTCEVGTVYHAAGVRQGPFRLELPLPAAVDSDSVSARYERGLLRIMLRKAESTP